MQGSCLSSAIRPLYIWQLEKGIATQGRQICYSFNVGYERQGKHVGTGFSIKYLFNPGSFASTLKPIPGNFLTIIC